MIAGIPPWLSWTVLVVLGLNVLLVVNWLVRWLIDRDRRAFARWEQEMYERKDDDVT